MIDKKANLSRSDFSAWYESNYSTLTGHGLWLRPSSINAIPASEFETRPFRILISRLSTFFDVSESFSHKVLYQIAKKHPDMFPDFAYLPPVYDIPVFERDNVPWLLGAATKREAQSFDLIAFSNAIVQELINVPTMLQKSNIPLEKTSRLQNENLPLVILGGSNALYTSLFFVKEPPVDGIFFGDSIDCVEKIFTLCKDAKVNNLSKIETLKTLESVDGFVQPDNPVHTKRHIDMKPGLNDLLQTSPVTNDTAVCSTGNVQISEGCPCFCSFCSESFGKKPYREVSAKDVVALARTMKAESGLDKIELSSFNFNMHSSLYAILHGLAPLFPNIGLKSQRFDFVAKDPGMIAHCKAVGKSSLTFGLEGISERTRSYLHKSLIQEDLHASLTTILSNTIRELKIFLIITGLEEEQDYDEFVDLLKFMKSCTNASQQKCRIIFSATMLVRFPHTPLEFEDAPFISHIQPIIQKLRSCVERNDYEFRLSSDYSDYYLSQLLVRANDSRMYEALLSTITSMKYVYFRTLPMSFIESFLATLEKLGMTKEQAMTGAKDGKANKPWLAFDTGVSRKFVVKQHAAAQDFIDEGYCLGQINEMGDCKSCKACDKDAKKSILAARTATTLSPNTLKATMKKWTSNSAECSFLVDINEVMRGIPRDVCATALASAIMKTAPECTPYYAGFVRAFIASDSSSAWITGHEIFTIKWRSEGAKKLEALMQNQAAIDKINVLTSNICSLIAFNPKVPDRYTLAIHSPYAFEPNEYLSGKGITYILRNKGNGMYAFEFTKQGLKKNLVYELSYSPLNDNSVKCEMNVSHKLAIVDFVKQAFAIKEKNVDWVRVKTRIQM